MFVTLMFSMSLNRDCLDVSESLLCRAVELTEQFICQALVVNEDTGSGLLTRLLTPDDGFHSFVSELYQIEFRLTFKEGYQFYKS